MNTSKLIDKAISDIKDCAMHETGNYPIVASEYVRIVEDRLEKLKLEINEVKL